MSWQRQTGIGRNNFDFIRFTLAVAVILSHSFALVEGRLHEPLVHLTRNQLSLGDLAVDWFFVISGFLIVHSWLRSQSALEYMKKRVLRIYPGFIGAILFCTFIAVPLAAPSIRGNLLGHIHPIRFIGQTVRLRYVKPSGTFPKNRSHAVNGSLWSISYEFWCYIGVLALGLAGLLKKPRAIFVFFIAILTISILFIIANLNPGGKKIFFPAIFGSARLWSRMLPYYAAGVVFYVFRNQIPFSRLMALASAALLLLLPLWSWATALILPIAGTYILFWFAFEPRIRLENWARYGDFSYGIYVFAFPIQQLILMKFGPKMSPLILFALATPLVVIAGAISWHLIERRFLKMKKSMISHHAQQATPATQLAQITNS